MNEQVVIGIDIGGQTSKCGIVDARGDVLAQSVVRSDTHSDVKNYITDLASALRKLIDDAGVKGNIRGIGVGAPNANYYTGEIENAVNLTWGVNGHIPFAKMHGQPSGRTYQ